MTNLERVEALRKKRDLLKQKLADVEQKLRAEEGKLRAREERLLLDEIRRRGLNKERVLAMLAAERAAGDGGAEPQPQAEQN